MTQTIPTSLNDPINAKILEISEDRIPGFSPNPIAQIAKETALDPNTIIDRISAMLRAGVIRRVRQTLLATNLAQGTLVAWVVPRKIEFRLRLDVPARPLLRPRRHPQH